MWQDLRPMEVSALRDNSTKIKLPFQQCQVRMSLILQLSRHKSRQSAKHRRTTVSSSVPRSSSSRWPARIIVSEAIRSVGNLRLLTQVGSHRTWATTLLRSSKIQHLLQSLAGSKSWVMLGSSLVLVPASLWNHLCKTSKHALLALSKEILAEEPPHSISRPNARSKRATS